MTQNSTDLQMYNTIVVQCNALFNKILFIY